MRRLLICLALMAGFGLAGAGPALAATPCAPGYKPCLPVARDLDCPEVLEATGGDYVVVTGEDQYRLDRDGDGFGCEPAGVGDATPTPTTAPTKASPSATPSRQPVAANADGASDNEPTLPVTGSSVLPVVAGGLALLVVGAVGVVAIGRRRRVRFRA